MTEATCTGQRYTHPLAYPQELVGDDGCRFLSLVYRNGYNKRQPRRHVVRALHREQPFSPEIALAPRLYVCGHDSDEEGAFADLFPNLGVPVIAASQLLLIKPNLDASPAKRVCDAG